MESRRALFLAPPFLVALVPVFSLWSSNADQVDPGVAGLASLAALALAGGLLGLALALCRDWLRAGLIASLFTGLFVSYGALCDASSRPIALALVSVAALGGALWFARTQRELSNWSAVVTAGAAAWLAFSGVQLGVAALDSERARDAAQHALAGPGVAAGEPIAPVLREDPALPDIYYIVLDGYAGAEVLQRVFHTDNTAFLDALRQRGFAVAGDSRSNYAMTHLSLSSVLNATYLDALTRELGQDELSFDAPYALLRQPWVARFLRAHGYRYVQLFTNWGGSERSDIADVGYAYAPAVLRSEFAGVLLRATLLRDLAPSVAGFHRHAFEAIREVPRIEGPTFLFAHLLLPHEPYVFDREGRVRADIPLHLRASPVEKEKSAAGRADAAYADQLHYLNGEVLSLVDDLLEASPQRPIIVIQGDHGWASHATEPGSEEFVRDRFPILNAFLVPEKIAARLYPSISPVNTFRLLLSETFGAELPLLPDRQFSSWYDAPYQLKDVTSSASGAQP